MIDSLWGRIQTDYFVVTQRINQAYTDLASLEVRVTDYIDTSVLAVSDTVTALGDTIRGELDDLDTVLRDYVTDGLNTVETTITVYVDTLRADMDLGFVYAFNSIQDLSDNLTVELTDIQSELSSLSDMFLDQDTFLDLLMNTLESAWGD